MDPAASPALQLASSVTVTEVHLFWYPTLDVTVGPADGVQMVSTPAVAVTGAQVCVAGPPLLSSLRLRPVLLQRQADLRNVAIVQCLGSAP